MNHTPAVDELCCTQFSAVGPYSTIGRQLRLPYASLENSRSHAKDGTGRKASAHILFSVYRAQTVRQLSCNHVVESEQGCSAVDDLSPPMLGPVSRLK
jgi:hypothetical protein